MSFKYDEYYYNSYFSLLQALNEVASKSSRGRGFIKYRALSYLEGGFDVAEAKAVAIEILGKSDWVDSSENGRKMGHRQPDFKTYMCHWLNHPARCWNCKKEILDLLEAKYPPPYENRIGVDGVNWKA